MKTGFDNGSSFSMYNKEQIEDMQIMLCLFVSNAMLNASKYCELCDRDGITKEDVVYGIRYEVFEFLKRDNLEKALKEMKEDYEEEMEIDTESEDGDECIEEDTEYRECMIDGETMDEVNNNKEIDSIDDMIVDDDEIDDFRRIQQELLSKLEKSEDIIFIDNMHKYYDTWDSWVPETPLEKILKSGIDKMY
jgi:histone H3/H4